MKKWILIFMFLTGPVFASNNIMDKATITPVPASDYLYIVDNGTTDGKATISAVMTASESVLEGVLDLQDLQGAVTDAQVPDNITITDNATQTWVASQSYLTEETDPKISTLTNTKWCTTNGTVITCTEDEPAGGHDAVTLSVAADTILSLSTQEVGLDVQTANYVWAGPVSGAAASPTFRALGDDDIPNDITITETDPQVGAVTDNNVCQGDGDSVECDLTIDATGDCAAGTVCGGGHGHSGYESATSNDIDPDRLAGDTVDDNLIDEAIIDADIARDSELPTVPVKWGYAIENPVDTDDVIIGEVATAETYTSIYCKTLVGTVDLDVTIGGADINGTDITCTTTGVLDETLAGDTSGAVGDEVALAITSVASDPTYLIVILNGTQVTQ